jgi:phage-related protein
MADNPQDGSFSIEFSSGLDVDGLLKDVNIAAKESVKLYDQHGKEIQSTIQNAVKDAHETGKHAGIKAAKETQTHFQKTFQTIRESFLNLPNSLGIAWASLIFKGVDSIVNALAKLPGAFADGMKYVDSLFTQYRKIELNLDVNDQDIKKIKSDLLGIANDTGRAYGDVVKNFTDLQRAGGRYFDSQSLTRMMSGISAFGDNMGDQGMAQQVQDFVQQTLSRGNINLRALEKNGDLRRNIFGDASMEQISGMGINEFAKVMEDFTARNLAQDQASGTNFTEIMNMFKNTGARMVEEIFTPFREVFNSSWFSDLGKSLEGFAVWMGKAVRETIIFVKNLADKMWPSVEKIFTSIGDTLYTLGQIIYPVIKALWDWNMFIQDSLSPIFEDFWEFVSLTIDNIRLGAIEVIKFLGSFKIISYLADIIVKAFKDVWYGLTGLIGTIFRWLKDTAKQSNAILKAGSGEDSASSAIDKILGDTESASSIKAKKSANGLLRSGGQTESALQKSIDKIEKNTRDTAQDISKFMPSVLELTRGRNERNSLKREPEMLMAGASTPMR